MLSRRISTPMANCMTGVTYWSRPMLDSGSRVAAAAKKSRGSAGTGPAEMSRRRWPRGSPRVRRTWRHPARARTTSTTGAGRGGHRALDEQALRRRGAHPLLEESVSAEGRRQDQGDPWRPAVVDAQDQDRDDAKCHRRPLHRAEPLVKDDDAEADGHQWIDEVAEARLDDVAVVDPPDVDAPVDRDGDARSTQPPDRPSVKPANPTELMTDAEQDGDDGEAEDDAPRQDLERVRRLEQRPVQRNEAPEQVRAEPVEQSTRRRRGFGSQVCAREEHASLRDAPPTQRGLVKRVEHADRMVGQGARRGRSRNPPRHVGPAVASSR